MPKPKDTEPPVETPWPNQTEVVDGVTPVAEVSQDPLFFGPEDFDADRQMGE